jgi:hypothetical protein
MGIGSEKVASGSRGWTPFAVERAHGDWLQKRGDGLINGPDCTGGGLWEG